MVDMRGFTSKTMDWRTQLANNNRKTRIVIATFIGIYLLVGLLVDVFIVIHHYPGVPLSRLIEAFITLQLTPYATIIMGVIASLSLWITYQFYDKVMLMGTTSRLITPETALSLEEKQLYNVVEEMKVAAGLSYMPKVFLIEADYMNAFASGYSEKSAMVAITYGLLMKLERDELQAVMAHELSHIRHNDIKLTLTVGVLSNIMLIVIDILFYAVVFRHRRDENANRLALVIIVLRYILPLITIMLTLFLSRTREYMADAGCVALTRNNEPLARALLKINEDHGRYRDEYRASYDNTRHEDLRRAAYIFDPVTAGIESKFSANTLFATHPPLKDRLVALGFGRKD